jgi:hypothetical protein
MICTLVLQLQPGRRSFNHDGGGVDLSAKHKAVTVLTPLHSEYLLHVSSKRNFHELDNRLEAKIDYLLHVSSNIRSVDDREDGAESLDKMLTLLTTTIKNG